MFKPYNQEFNDYKNYTKDQLSIYRITMLHEMSPSLRRHMLFLISHISTDTSIVRFNTLYIHFPVADIYFLKEKVNEETIYSALASDTLTVYYRGGKTGRVVNPFKFREKGKTLKAD
jgi:hypothetical protein